jgi:hypothetical protein
MGGALDAPRLAFPDLDSGPPQLSIYAFAARGASHVREAVR